VKKKGRSAYLEQHDLVYILYVQCCVSGCHVRWLYGRKFKYFVVPQVVLCLVTQFTFQNLICVYPFKSLQSYLGNKRKILVEYAFISIYYVIHGSVMPNISVMVRFTATV
jgi:hypothetical protein